MAVNREMEVLSVMVVVYCCYFTCTLFGYVHMKKPAISVQKATGEPLKASGQRLQSEAKMRTSAEAYLRGSADVSSVLKNILVCV